MAPLIFLSYIFLSGGRNDDQSRKTQTPPSDVYLYRGDGGFID